MHRIIKQAVTAEVSVLGGLCLKPLLPSVEQVLGEFLQRNSLELPSGPLTTVYCAEYQGNLYFSRQYQRVKKRNSYTVVYSDGEAKQYALIEHFVFVNHRLVAILKPLSLIPVARKDHFDVSTTALDTLSFLIPVVITDVVKCCFVEKFISKCLFIDFGYVKYVLEFPSSIIFD